MGLWRWSDLNDKYKSPLMGDPQWTSFSLLSITWFSSLCRHIYDRSPNEGYLMIPHVQVMMLRRWIHRWLIHIVGWCWLMLVAYPEKPSSLSHETVTIFLAKSPCDWLKLEFWGSPPRLIRCFSMRSPVPGIGSFAVCTQWRCQLQGAAPANLGAGYSMA